MKSKCTNTFWGIALFLVSVNVYADFQDEEWEKNGYQPLTESEWAENPDNQNLLPYSRCRPVTGRFEWKAQADFILIGTSYSTLGSDVVNQLWCVSEDPKVAYRIPIDIKSTNYFGVRGELPFSDSEDFTNRISKLNGKTFGDIIGVYNGFEGSIAAILGISGQVLFNSKGIKVESGALKYGAGVTLGWATQAIYPREYYYSREVNSRYLLVNGTRPRTQDDWKALVGKTLTPLIGDYYAVDNDKLRNLKFVKTVKSKQ